MSAYVEALEWLYGLSARGVRLELDRMRGAVGHRGHPERAVPAVHVAGTNGKGSVCAFVERALREAGYRTGHFASPHLHRFAERVRIDGEPLAETEVAERLAELRAALPAMPPLTFFEVATLMAFEAFRDHRCDIAVLEVGLGGRLDATNVVTDPRVSVITRIARDHVRILGDTFAQIAVEKGGILRRGVPAVLGVRQPEARAALEPLVEATGTKGWWIGDQFDGHALGDGSTDRPLDAPSRARLRVGDRATDHALGLRGGFQASNAAVARATLARLGERGFPSSEDAIARGLEAARWPGRLEVFADEGRTVVIDCAHNPDGSEALAEFLRSRRVPQPAVLLFGAMADKEHEGMLAPFDGLVHERFYAVPPLPRAPADLAVFTQVRPGIVASSVAEGIDRARGAAGDRGTLVVAGSIFLVQEVRARLLGERSDPPIAM